MKKGLSILLLVFYFFSTTELIELVKLPVLVRHFQQHKAWDKQITFFEFIFEHYAESIDNNPDVDLDRKLPFKSHDNHPNFQNVISIPFKICHYNFFLKTIFLLRSPNFAYFDRFNPIHFSSEIWQPPQF